MSSKKRPLEDAASSEPPSKKQKIATPEPKEDVVEEFMVKFDIVEDYIKKEDVKIHYNHSLILSNWYKKHCNTDKPLIKNIEIYILKYSILNPLFKTIWSTQFKGRNLLLNESKLSLYASQCDTNESCRCNEPFPKNKKSKIKFKFYRNDECCFQASFVGIHHVNSSNKSTANYMYNYSPFSPTDDGIMYKGAINRISYGLLECGGWIHPKTNADDIDYEIGQFRNQDVIVMEADFTNEKNKKLTFFMNDNEKPIIEKTLKYFGPNDEWYPAVGFGSGES